MMHAAVRTEPDLVRPLLPGPSGAGSLATGTALTGRHTGGGASRKPHPVRPEPYRRRLYRMTILDCNGSPPASSGWPDPVRASSSLQTTNRRPFHRPGHARRGHKQDRTDP